MNWIELTDVNEVAKIIEKSNERRQAIFKHSTRCIISKTVKRNFEAELANHGEGIDIYHLDLIARRDISAKIADLTGVIHQSPQLIVLDKGEVIHHSSHQGVSGQAVLA